MLTKYIKALPPLPALLQTALLALLSASIPLDTTYTATITKLDTSMHVFAFSAEKQLLVAESEGDFKFEDWDVACAEAEEECIRLGTLLRKGLGT
jgi:exosome complex component RRP46